MRSFNRLFIREITKEVEKEINQIINTINRSIDENLAGRTNVEDETWQIFEEIREVNSNILEDLQDTSSDRQKEIKSSLERILTILRASPTDNLNEAQIEEITTVLYDEIIPEPDSPFEI